jgi:multicomponent Na+:H+ antiporter subunit F
MIIAALVLVVVGGACFLYRAVAGPSLADRVVALDGLVMTIVAGVLVNSIRVDSSWFVDVGLVVAFTGFVGTAAGARFIERRGG